MKYEIQIKTETADKKEKEFRSVRPTGGIPYRYETSGEARRMLDLCYPDVVNEHKRIVQVE